MDARARIAFIEAQPSSRRIETRAELGTTILDAARAAGVDVNATCGERGRCRSCRVKIIKGEVPPPSIMDTVQLGHEEVQEQFRLSCQARIVSDVTIMVAPPKAESGHKILAINSEGPARSAVPLDSGVTKIFATVKLPDDENHQSSDVEELIAATGITLTRPIPPDILRKVPSAVRDRFGEVTVTCFDGELIDIEAGDSSGHKYGMAFDIGTTSIVASLIDLNSGAELATAGGVNPQAQFGGDLMSRIAYVQEEPKRLQTLRAKVLGALNAFITEASRAAGINPAHIHKAVVVGNTCMHHIFLGIDPTYVGLAPYAPSVRSSLVLTGKDCLLKAIPNARICLLPLIAGFVGADTIAAVIATRIYESDELKALVDIGTNGEVVMGRKGHLVACSAPAGPAFEGAQIRHGMRGAVGAIERVEIDKDIDLHVIGDAPPIGICGSGLIDAVAAMLDAGIINERGQIGVDWADTLPEFIRDRLRSRGDRDEFVLAWAAETGKEEDVTLNQSDIRQLQLAKGAICSGVVMLQHVLGIGNDDIAELMLCGGFGNYVNRESARRIRLLPAVPVERIAYYGNAAGLGAQLALLSETERRRADELARQIEHVSLATHPDFQDIFVEALKFPPIC